MIILLDQDGVLSDYNTGLYERWADRHPQEFDEYHIPFERVPYDITGYYTGVVQEHLKAIENEPGFFGSLPPIAGAVDAAHELLALGHRVCICTRPSKHRMAMCALEKFQWIHMHLGEAFVERMMVVRDKTFAHGDILIDDKPEITGALKHPAWKHVLYDWPYNRHVNKPRLSWDTNWREVLMELDEQ